MIKRFTKHLIVRYLISGGTSAAVNILIFSLFFYVFNFHYIVSNIIGFSLAFLVSLGLQKFWTFQDHSTHNIHIQGFIYLLSSLFGLSINTFVLYICVDIAGMYPLLGVIVSGIVTAMITFQISSRYIFNRKDPELLE